MLLLNILMDQTYKSMKTLKESILDDIDIQMDNGNDLIKAYKKAEKDYIKLLKKTTHKVQAVFANVTIKSPELAMVLAGDTEIYKYVTSSKYNQPVDRVSVIYRIDDIYSNQPVYKLEFQVVSYTITGRKTCAILSASIPYSDIGPGVSLDLNSSVTTKEIIEVTSEMFLKKYKSLDDVVKVFKDNIFYTMKTN